MVSVRLSVTHVTVALLAWIGLTTFLQVGFGEEGLLRWSGYVVLTPVVAGALLPRRQTLLVAAVNLAVAGFVYGFVIHQSIGGRIVVLVALVLASLIGTVVCRVRLDREERLARMMIARDRLSVLSRATTQVGTTLDVVRTARELAEVAVPRFADFVTVDLFDSVLAGGEPEEGPFEGPVRLRRVAHKSVLDNSPEAVLDLGESDLYPPISVPARALATGNPVKVAQLLDEAEVRAWLGGDPRRPATTEDYGVHTGMTIPLRSRGAVLGVAAFIRHRRPDPFDADDLLLAEEVASRASVCLDNAHRFTREHRRSLTLQRSLLPRGLPENPAVETASRYLPSGTEAGVGGDWFDVIPLSGARVGLVVGDVVGHGMHASATMGRLRAAVRTLADIDLPPDELLTHLDDVVTRLGTEAGPSRRGRHRGRAGDRGRTEAGAGDGGGPLDPLPAGEIGATCLYAVYDPVSRRFTVARAGHPPPALVAPDGTTRFIDLPAGPPLGTDSLPFESVELELAEGSTLALYTNGLVESRSREPDNGLDLLRRALSGPCRSLESTCDAVLKALLDEQHTDDIALLLARTRTLDAQHVVAWDLPPDPASVGRARELANSQMAAWGLEGIAFTAELVVSELVTNAVRYGEAPVQLRLIREKTLICEVSDGSSTAPHLRRARTLDEGGRGLFIVAQLTDRWGTRHGPQGKTIWSELSLTTNP